MFQPLYLFPSITLVSAFRTDITRKDIDTLKGLNWLNDEVINFYMQMIVERSQEHDNWPNVYAFNTFFYPKIMQQGHASVKRWTRKVGEGGVQAIETPSKNKRTNERTRLDPYLRYLSNLHFL